MGKHNYSQYSNNKNFEVYDEVVETVAPVEEEVVTEPVVEETVTLVEETVETVTLPEVVSGTVVGCTKLNVRVSPSATADVVCVLDVKSEIKINAAKSDNEWFSICTATGIEGYCMRKFVEANL
jgi:hypothetical protein